MKGDLTMNRYSLNSTLGEILEAPAALALIKEIAPGMADSPMMTFAKVAKLSDLMESSSGGKKKMFMALLNVANGLEVEFTMSDEPEPPQARLHGEPIYNIDEIDGQMYMLERKFSGCLIIRFTKQLDESVYGHITWNGKALPKGVLKSIEIAGGSQMLGVPVRDVFTEYDTEYTLHIEGFTDTEGLIMEPQDITIRTLPKPMADPTYAEHDAVALEAAREGIVLLKNDGVLPLPSDQSLHLFGASEYRRGTAGAGRINPRYSISLLRGIEELSNFKLVGAADECIGVIVICRGSGENLDASAIPGEFYLTNEEETLIENITEKQSQTIAIINTGYPIDLRWVDKYGVGAVIWCGYPGMLGGQALVEILDGRVNPSGKLPDTWSLDYYDIPASANFYNAVEGKPVLTTDSPYFADTVYEEDLYVGYRYFETFNKPVAYSFGHGLSYTSFSINASEPHMSRTDHSLEKLRIVTSITNTGPVAGKEVVQVYVNIPDGKLEQPTRRLVGFSKTSLLSPGETEELQIEISKSSLSSFDTETACWIIEQGRYEFHIGNSLKNLEPCGELILPNHEIVKKVNNLMSPPCDIEILSKLNSEFPKGMKSGVKKEETSLTPAAVRKHYTEKNVITDDFVSQLSVEELARLSVCASSGWGMHENGEAGRIFKLDGYDMPDFIVADGNNGVNLKKPNIGLPCSNTVCATFNSDLAYEIGRVIAEEAKENNIQMILAPGMNLHRNPLNGRHPEYFSEDPYLSGIMAGNQSKGLEEHGVSSCLKHTIGNNCESVRKRNHSIMTERALRELYVKTFEVAMNVHMPDSIMTGYNAVNGVFTGEDEEMIQGIFRSELGFEGFVMTDWNSYDTVDIASAIQAGNCWMTPGSIDNTYVTPIIQGVRDGKIDLERLRSNIRFMLRVVQKRTGKDLGVQ
jgi:beta-glucosidase